MTKEELALIKAVEDPGELVDYLAYADWLTDNTTELVAIKQAGLIYGLRWCAKRGRRPKVDGLKAVWEYSTNSRSKKKSRLPLEIFNMLSGGVYRTDILTVNSRLLKRQYYDPINSHPLIYAIWRVGTVALKLNKLSEI